MSIDYEKVYERVDEFLQTREGLADPKVSTSYRVFVRELAGILCGTAYENTISSDILCQYLDLVQVHYITDVINTGKVCMVSDLIDPIVKNHPLYDILERDLMVYKPGSVQVGPGEFFMCFYDAGSVFGIDNQAGYDVKVGQHNTEMKALRTNLTTPELFDKYAEIPHLDRLMVVKPISGAARPRVRSQYASINVDKWRDAYYHRNGVTLAYKEGII